MSPTRQLPVYIYSARGARQETGNHALATLVTATTIQSSYSGLESDTSTRVTESVDGPLANAASEVINEDFRALRQLGNVGGLTLAILGFMSDMSYINGIAACAIGYGEAADPNGQPCSSPDSRGFRRHRGWLWSFNVYQDAQYRHRVQSMLSGKEGIANPHLPAIGSASSLCSVPGVSGVS